MRKWADGSAATDDGDDDELWPGWFGSIYGGRGCGRGTNLPMHMEIVLNVHINILILRMMATLCHLEKWWRSRRTHRAATSGWCKDHLRK